MAVRNLTKLFIENKTEETMKKLILLGIILSQFSSVHASVFYQDGATINTTLKTECWNGKTGFNVFGRSDISCVKLSDEEVQNAIEINSRLNTERERNNHHKEYVYIAIMIFFTIVVLVHGGGFILTVIDDWKNKKKEKNQ